MTFQTLPVNITGPSYQSRSRPLSSQQTKNWYQQFSEAGKDKYVLMPFPGLKPLGVAVAGVDRGTTNMAEVMFQVKGTTLYSIAKNGDHVSRGSVPGTSRCIFANDGINLFIVSSSDKKVWHYNGSTVVQVTDTNIDGSQAVDFLNNQFIYTKPPFVIVSDVGDGSSASGLNIINPESNPDEIVRAFVFEEVIEMMSARTIEGWWNSGVGSPPIDRIQNQIFEVGLAALHSVAKTDEAFYWLGDDNAVYRSRSGSEQRISSKAISHQISTYNVVSDAIGYTFTLEGQNFYQITFPSADKTFVLSEELGENGWFEVSGGISDGRHQGSSLLNIYNKNLVADESNGQIYELDLETYTNNGDTLQRARVTSSVNGDILGKKGARVQMSRLEIIMETGVGVIEGQGDNPRIMVETSDDGGRTWAAGDWPEVGRLGEFILKVEFFNLDSFYDRMFRISTSDPVNYSIYSAAIDLRLAGR